MNWQQPYCVNELGLSLRKPTGGFVLCCAQCESYIYALIQTEHRSHGVWPSWKPSSDMQHELAHHMRLTKVILSGHHEVIYCRFLCLYNRRLKEEVFALTTPERLTCLCSLEACVSSVLAYIMSCFTGTTCCLDRFMLALHYYVYLYYCGTQAHSHLVNKVWASLCWKPAYLWNHLRLTAALTITSTADLTTYYIL